MTNWLLFGILLTSAIRMVLAIGDRAHVQALNKAALKRAEEWERQNQELRKQELADMKEIAKASGAMEQMLKDFTEGK